MVHVAYLMLLFPLAGFLLLVALGRRIGDPVAGWIGTVAVGASFVSAIVVFFVLVVAAAEVVVGLGIVVTNYRRRDTTVADDLDSLKG